MGRGGEREKEVGGGRETDRVYNAKLLNPLSSSTFISTSRHNTSRSRCKKNGHYRSGSGKQRKVGKGWVLRACIT